jgi:putative transposase
MYYRRARHAGGTFSFTVNLADRRQSLLTENIEQLRAAFRRVKRQHPYHIDAIVVLPDHIHAVWTLPEGDAGYPMRWQLIKAYFSRGLPKNERISASRNRKGERGIWQRRYWEHLIRDETDYQNHLDYIHFNPVKHGYVDTCNDWLYSSFHRYVRTGALPPDWGDDFIVDSDTSFGE